MASVVCSGPSRASRNSPGARMLGLALIRCCGVTAHAEKHFHPSGGKAAPYFNEVDFDLPHIREHFRLFLLDMMLNDAH